MNNLDPTQINDIMSAYLTPTEQCVVHYDDVTVAIPQGHLREVLNNFKTPQVNKTHFAHIPTGGVLVFLETGEISPFSETERTFAFALVIPTATRAGFLSGTALTRLMDVVAL